MLDLCSTRNFSFAVSRQTVSGLILTDCLGHTTPSLPYQHGQWFVAPLFIMKTTSFQLEQKTTLLRADLKFTGKEPPRERERERDGMAVL